MPALPALAEVIVFALASRDVTAHALRPLQAAVESRDIVLLDLVVLTRRPDGGARFVEIDKAPQLAPFIESMVTRTPCLSMADIVSLGAAIEPDSTAVFVAYESCWSCNLETQIAQAGGHVLTHGLLPTRAREPVLPAS